MVYKANTPFPIYRRIIVLCSVIEAKIERNKPFSGGGRCMSADPLVSGFPPDGAGESHGEEPPMAGCFSD